MKHYLTHTFFLILLGIAFGCAKDGGNNAEPDEQEDNGEQPVEFSSEGAVQGILYINEEPVEMMGNYKIDDDQFEIISVSGNLSGPITAIPSGYRITFDDFSGRYETDAEGMVGEITLTGSEIEKLVFESAHINGAADLTSLRYLESLDLEKSVVYFAHHLLGRNARIVLEDETGQFLDPLGHHYETRDESSPDEGRYCAIENYKLTFNSDALTSKLIFPGSRSWFWASEGNPHAALARFVVAKEKDINYTVHWDNGHREQGRFYSDIGGSVKNICIGVDAGGIQRVHAIYEQAADTYNSLSCWTYYSYSGCTAGRTNMTIGLAEDFYVFISNFPEETGLYRFDRYANSCYDFSGSISFPDNTSLFITGGFLQIEENNHITFKFDFDHPSGNIHTIRGDAYYIVTRD